MPCVDTLYGTIPNPVNMSMSMNFKEGSSRLIKSVTLIDIARETGMSDATIRRARLDPDTKSYRSPPQHWQQAIAKLARERAGELVKLAEELEG